MKLFRFLSSRIFFINAAVASVLLIIIFVIAYRWLAVYTEHGSTITVPDLRGMKISELKSFLNNKSLRYKISDSSIFDLNKPPGTIIEQDPSTGEKVKENRTIYVSITRSMAPVIKMPDLTDVSFRQAEAILSSYGLKCGKISYKPDLCKNCVLGFELNGIPLKSGSEVTKGTMIDLILGDGFGNTSVSVPDLLGLSLDEALFVLKGSLLNAGAIIPDASVKDTMHALVYKQYPAAGDSISIRQGEAVDLFITQSKYLLQKAKENLSRD